MGAGKWILGTVAAIVAMLTVLFAIGLVPIPEIPWFPGLPKCTLGKSYYDPAIIEQYNLNPSQGMDSCDCTGNNEWVSDSTPYGNFCIPMDNTRPDCIPGKFEDSLLNCNCISPNEWEGDDSGGFICDD